jgi:ribulose 1,5-bisphosphate synthetase/thiazole synthase
MSEKEKVNEKDEDYVSPLMTRMSVETENSFADSKVVTVGSGTSGINEDWGTDDTGISGNIDL